jgi:two-component system, NtrC family, nitrogen regulation sensor histidine kinase NtrY
MFSKQQLYILWTSLALFALTAISDLFFSIENNTHRYQNTIEDYLHHQEKRVKRWFEEKNFIAKYINPTLDSSNALIPQIEELSQEAFHFFIYKDSSLLFWSNKNVQPPPIADLPDPSLTFEPVDNYHFTVLKESQYEQCARTYWTPDSHRVTIVGLIPIKKVYASLEGGYLENHFPASSWIPSQLTLAADSTNFPIKTATQKTLCYIDNKEATADKMHDIWFILLATGGFVMLGRLGDGISKQLLQNSTSIRNGMLFFTLQFIVLRLGIHMLEKSNYIPGLTQYFAYFKPNSLFVLALSSMLIHTVFLLWMAVFIDNYFMLPVTTHRYQRIIKPFSLYFLVIMLLVLIVGVINDIVKYSDISLSFDNMFNIKMPNFIAITSLGLMLIAVFLICRRFVEIVESFQLPFWKVQFPIILVNAALSMPFFYMYDLNLQSWILFIFIVIYIATFRFFIQQHSRSLIWLVIWLVILSAMPSIFISILNGSKEAKTLTAYARYLGNERDAQAEGFIKNLKKQIENDGFLKSFSAIPFHIGLDTTAMIRRIDKYYDGSNYLSSHYRLKYYAYNRLNQAVFKESNANLEKFNRAAQERQTVKSDSTIYFWTDNKGSYSYLTQSVIYLNDRKDNPIYIVMEFTRQDMLSSRVSTELLVGLQFKSIPHLDHYSYAIYKDNICVEQNRIGTYDKYLNTKWLPERDFTKKMDIRNTREDLLYRSPNDIAVIIGKETTSSFSIVNLMTYIFLTLMATLFVLAIVDYFLIPILPKTLRFNYSLTSSLGNRIQIPTIGFILFSFILLGFFTISFFKATSARYYERDMEEKTASILSTIIDDIRELNRETNAALTQKKIQETLERLANVHQTAIHYFNPDGGLSSSSEKNLFDKGIVSKYMNPLAYATLKNQLHPHYNTEEHLGKYHYKTSYYTVRDTGANVLGFLELPLYSRDRKLRTEISTFLGWILFAYLALFIGGAGMAFNITLQIVEPIKQLGEHLKRLTLGKQNEMIERRNDEIGLLIDAYNTKVTELDESALALQESERRNAWREMAKQVAHEIRNPLTPIRLAVQHLDVIRIQHPHLLDTYVARSNKVVLEQLDSLERILKEFSDLAKMPQANSEEFILNELIESVFTLFGYRRSDVELNLHMPDLKFSVYADRNLLTNALNNLLINAAQAIPASKKGKIDLSVYRRDRSVVIKITDNGSGIPKDIQEKIFKPNFTTKSYGSGLGLLITKNIVESVNGKLYFETEEDVGTSFFLELDIQSIIPM